MLLFLLPHARTLGRGLQQAGARRWAPQTLNLGDRAVGVRVSSLTPNGAPQLLFSTPVARFPPLTIRRPGWLDRLARVGGFARVAASGDAAFDRRTLVSCDYRELAGLLLREPATREAILALLDAGAHSVRLEDGELTASFDASGDPQTLQQHAQRRAELLAELARQPMSLIGALTPMTALWPLRRASLLIGAALLPLVALGACIVLLDRYAPLDLPRLVFDALKLAPLWWLAALLPALIWLRGHPDSARLLPVALLSSGLAAAPASVAVHVARNAGDAAAAQETVYAVTGSVMLSGADAPTLRWSSAALQRRGLFGTPHSLSTQVSEAQWQTTPIANARLHARIAPGRLGYPWLVSVTAASVAGDARADTRVDRGPPSSEASSQIKRPGIALQLAQEVTPGAARGAELLAQAKALLDDGEPAEAAQVLDRALTDLAQQAATASLRADAHWLRAQAFDRLGAPFDRSQEADARAALALLPDHRGAALLLDALLMQRHDYAEALQLWNTVLAGKSGDAYARYKRAQLLAATGALAAAREEAQAACRQGEQAACDLAGSF